MGWAGLGSPTFMCERLVVINVEMRWMDVGSRFLRRWFWVRVWFKVWFLSCLCGLVSGLLVLGYFYTGSGVVGMDDVVCGGSYYDTSYIYT